MAEICPECLNKIKGGENHSKKYILSKELELCEECGEWKAVVVTERRFYYYRKFRFFLFPFKAIRGLMFVVYRILMLLIDRKRKNSVDWAN